jgi:hypothetical protein
MRRLAHFDTTTATAERNAYNRGLHAEAIGWRHHLCPSLPGWCRTGRSLYHAVTFTITGCLRQVRENVISRNENPLGIRCKVKEGPLSASPRFFQISPCRAPPQKRGVGQAEWVANGAEGTDSCNSPDRKRGGKVITSTYGREDRITTQWSGPEILPILLIT